MSSEIVKALYQSAFTVWNTLMKLAITLFTTSPGSAAGGGPYSTVYSFYSAISDATVPIATVFFIIAIYKTVISSPPEQQAQRFLMDALRYCIILYISANMWNIMGDVMNFCDGITSKFGSTTNYTLSVSGDLERIIDECMVFPSFSISGDWIGEFFSYAGYGFFFFISGIILLFIMVASCMSIISSGFQRILKPLIILPFAGIAIALGAGGHDISRSLVQYIRTFFGYCISGALMVICIKVGVSLCTTFVSFSFSGNSDIERCILITVQAAITPIVIAGMVKACDSMAQRMF